jgi:hypothetical protein
MVSSWSLCEMAGMMNTSSWIALSLKVVCLMLYIYAQDADAASCLLNKCLCTTTHVNCGDYRVNYPQFTTRERRYVLHIVTRWGHLPWLDQNCQTFPRLQSVVVGTHEVERNMLCPTLQRCPTIKLQCL